MTNCGSEPADPLGSWNMDWTENPLVAGGLIALFIILIFVFLATS